MLLHKKTVHNCLKKKTRYIGSNNNRSLLSWKSQSLIGREFFSEPSVVIGKVEIRARSLGLILYVDNNQKNNMVHIKMNHIKLCAERCKNYAEDDHALLVVDDVDFYFGYNADEEIIEKDDMQNNNNGSNTSIRGQLLEYGLYVLPILSLESGKNNNSSKDLIAVPLCHIHYNAKTNFEYSLVTDTFEAKWGQQTFILPLDLRPFDNIGKAFKKYHRDFTEIVKQQKQMQAQNQATQTKMKVQINGDVDNFDDDGGHGNNNNKVLLRHPSSSISISLSNQHLKRQQSPHHNQHHQQQNSNQQQTNSKTFTHDIYRFEPPFPSVKYIVKTETILEKLGIEEPNTTIPRYFYQNIVEPISDSFKIIRAVSSKIDISLSSNRNNT